jgi:hypothetical protein
MKKAIVLTDYDNNEVIAVYLCEAYDYDNILEAFNNALYDPELDFDERVDTAYEILDTYAEKVSFEEVDLMVDLF